MYQTFQGWEEVMKKLFYILIFALAVFISGCATIFSEDMQLSNQALESINDRNYIAAENYLKQALAENPNNPYALLNLGVVYQNTNRITEAKGMYEKVIKLNPTDVVDQSNMERVEGKTLADLAKYNLNMLIRTGHSTAVETSRDGRYISYDNGTVLDTKTNLMWAAKDNGSDINWVDAKYYCDNYRGGGYADWRMPRQDELAGLYDASKSRPAVCAQNLDIHVATNLIGITCFTSWASETHGPTAAFLVFVDGGRSWYPQPYVYGLRALPVRSVK
jgi:tetratricopeptide (TPR) repeat protein